MPPGTGEKVAAGLSRFWPPARQSGEAVSSSPPHSAAAVSRTGRCICGPPAGRRTWPFYAGRRSINPCSESTLARHRGAL